jgi:DNA polymerase-1
MKSKPQLFLIDAHALCYRSFYAIKGLVTSKGQPSNAVFGFVNTLRKILKSYAPEYMAVCFDSPKKTRRQEKFAEYKIQRPTMPMELIDQMQLIKDVVEAYRLPMYELGGYEADDIIATLAERFSKKGIDVVIVSDDKDMFQLANDRVKFFSTRKDEMKGEEELQEQLGFHPRQIVDFIALAGDNVDNIPGVKGIGQVTAQKLIKEYGDLDGIYQHLSDISSAKVQEILQKQESMAQLSRELALLEKDVPIDVDLEGLKVQEPDRQALHRLFMELEFQRFAKEYATEQTAEQSGAIQVKHSSEDIQELRKQIQSTRQVAFLLGVAGALNDGFPDTIFLTADGVSVYSILIKDAGTIADVLKDSNVVKITHDLKTTLKYLSFAGAVFEGKVFDVMLAAYLLGRLQASYSPTDLAWEYFKRTISDQDRFNRELQVVYELYALMLADLKKQSLDRLLNEVEIPLSYVLLRMEKNGVEIDENFLLQLSKECGGRITKLTEDIFAQAGESFNLNSPKQLAHILFEKLKLPAVKKTKTGFSTDETVLLKLAEKHEFPTLLLEYRQLAKLKSTYIDALPQLVNPKTGRIHAEFNQIGAETGRLSSRNPNLQNIPIRTDLGRQIRKAIYVSNKDCVMISADYSQIELRILAHLSKDENLLNAFRRDEDIHTYTASLILEIPEKEVTPQMRNNAKRVNFGIIYGMSAFGLAKDLNISQAEAQDFIDRYFLRYPDVKKFMDNCIKECEEQGFVLTLLNRRRYIPEINSPNNSLKQFAQRQAINTPVQGSAADLMKMAMINIQKAMDQHKLLSKMLITVHDELVFEVPLSEEVEMIKIIRETMENSLELSVPIKVTVKKGHNWLQMKEIE